MKLEQVLHFLGCFEDLIADGRHFGVFGRKLPQQGLPFQEQAHQGVVRTLISAVRLHRIKVVTGAYRVVDEFIEPDGNPFKLDLLFLEFCNFLLDFLGSRHEVLALKVNGDQFVFFAEPIESVFRFPELFSHISELIIDVPQSFSRPFRLVFTVQFLVDRGDVVGQTLSENRTSVCDFDV